MRSTEIRRLTDEDMPAAMAQVDDVFENEQGIPRWMNPLPAERSPIWWGLFRDGELKGTIASYVEDGQRHLGRMTVERSLRGQHFGSAILTAALEDLFTHGVEVIYMDARETTVHILLRLGAEILGEPYAFYQGTCTPLRITAEAFHPIREENAE